MRMAPSERGALRATIDGTLVDARAQHHWGAPHATWFTLMGVGGGIFLLSRLMGLEAHLGLWYGLPVVDLLSFVVIGAGGLVLVGTLGRPARVLRALARPRTSWISRGAIADFVFLVTGVLLVLPGLSLGGSSPFAWLPWEPSPTTLAGRVVEILALLSSVVVIYYAGQVLADPNAIPYWHSPAVPIQFVLSSLAISIGTVMLLETLNGVPVPAGQFWLLLAFLALLLVAVARHVVAGRELPGKAQSVEMLLRGRYRVAFLGWVVGAGTVLPIVLAVIALVAPGTRSALGIVTLACTLPAGFGLRLLTLRAGVYAPIRATLRIPAR